MSFTNVIDRQVPNWLQESFVWKGLRTVYQNWFDGQGRKLSGQSRDELEAFIRNFHWLHRIEKVGHINSSQALKAGSFLSDRSDDFYYEPEEVCGYYDNGVWGAKLG